MRAEDGARCTAVGRARGKERGASTEVARHRMGHAGWWGSRVAWDWVCGGEDGSNELKAQQHAMGKHGSERYE